MKREPKEGYVLLLNGQRVTIDEWHRRMGSKWKRRKPKGLWRIGSSQYSKRLAARKERRKGPWDENA